MAENLDVWKPEDDLAGARAARGAEPPPLAEGIPLRQALSLGTVLANGWALVRERPLLTLGVAAALWLLNFIPAGASGVLEAVGIFDPESVDPSEVMTTLPITLGLMALTMAILPVAMWIGVGLMHTLGVVVERDEVRWGLVLTSWRGALWLLVTATALYAVLVVVTVVLSLVFILIAGVAGGLLGLLAEAVVPGVSPEMVIVGVVVVAAGLLTLALIPVAVWISLSLLPVFLAIMVEERDPISALRVGWRAASGSRWSLLLMMAPVFAIQLVFGVGVGLVQVLVGPAGGLVAAVGVAPVAIAIDAIYRGGWAAGWLMHVRPVEQTRGWSFFQRLPSRWISA